MENIFEFPDKKGARERNDAKMELVSNCEKPMAEAIKAMRESFVQIMGRSSRF